MKIHKIKKAVIIAHSKGGLIGKRIMTVPEGKKMIAKLIAIATPFSGSLVANLINHKVINELAPDGKIINNLARNKAVNRKIVSIFGESDNFVQPTESSRLKGAKNIQVKIRGHHKFLMDKNVLKIILKEVGR